MIKHTKQFSSESWEFLPWKKFQVNLFRLQKRVYKAVRAGDKQKAKSLQKLILRSQAARFLAIRQVTQLNKGKKTAGLDGKLALSFKERGAFDSIHHQILMKLLVQRIVDEKFLKLIERFLKAGIMEGRLFKRTETGTP